jgi:alpha-1,6-mannosyltransferase
VNGDAREVDGEARTGRRRPAIANLTPINVNLALLILGGVSLFLYLRAQSLAPGTTTISAFVKIALLQCALYAIASFVAWRARASHTTLVVVILFAALFRLAIIFDPPRLSDDIYRYIWDGRVQAAGINPYRYVPADPALAQLRDAAIYEHVNRRDFAPTIYPPLAQMIFFAATRVSESVVWMKVLMVAFEACALCAIARLLASFELPRQRVLLAAWHPLMIWEIAGSGHLDAVMLCFVSLALLARRRNRDTLTGFFLACAALTKLFPVVLAPALQRRRDWKMPVAFAATCVAAYLPYLSVGARRVFGYLPGYADEEGLRTGTRFFILSLARRATAAAFEIPNAAYVLFTLAVLCTLTAWTLRAREGNDSPSDFNTRAFITRPFVARTFIARALILAAAFIVLFSPHYSWYFVWLVPFLCLVPPSLLVPVLYLTAASFVLYFTWLGDQPERMFVINSIIYLPFVTLCAATLLARRFID